jgi:cellulose synthase/poly-beta-1,6-N-acetylglucosamine synthase-like glycosyltransferase
MDRRALDLFNAIGVVPGAIGAWRKQALEEAGGYSSDTLAEDADLTITLERLNWRVVSERGAVALTEAPETLRSFMKQRFRWTFGTLQVGYKHASALRGRPSGVSLITIPNIFIFQIAFALLAPLFDGLLVYTVAMLAIGSGQSQTLLMLATYWLFFQTIDIAGAAMGIAINGDRSAWRMLPLLLVQRFSYRQLLYVVTARAILAAVKGRFIGWGKLIRTGSVVLPFTRSLRS